MLEEEVFPEELRNLDIQKKYVVEREIPREQLIPLNQIDQKLLPYIENEVESNVRYNELREELEEVLHTLKERILLSLRQIYILRPL